MENTELLTSAKGNPCLVVDGYRYRPHRRWKQSISWVCVKDKEMKCRGSVKTNFQYEPLSQTAHSCVPNVAEIEVKKVMQNCRKRVREETSVPVSKIFHEEIQQVYSRDYDLVAETPNYKNAKVTLCRERRKVLGNLQEPNDSNDIVFPQDILRLPNNEPFLRLDFKNHENKRILAFAGEDAADLLKKGKDFFFDGTFKWCPRQFGQLYSVHVDNGSTFNITSIYPVIFALLPDKRQATYVALFRALKEWCPEWHPNRIKMDFEAASINAAILEFPETHISGCAFHFNQYLWRRIQEIGLTVEYKNNEEIRKICRMCAALAHLPMEFVDEAWLIIMDDAPKHDKLTAFLDYFVDQWLDNGNIPIHMWNVHGQRHRMNNPVEGWNSKINKYIGRKQPNAQLLIKYLKEESIRNSFHLKLKDLGEPGIKRKNMYVKVDERIQSIITEFHQSNNLRKCLISLSYRTMMS